MYFYNVFLVYNRPFTSYPKPLFQNETKREAIDVTMIFYSHAQKTYFHKKSLLLSEAIDVTMIFYSHAQKTYFHKKSLLLSLVLKQRLEVTMTTYLMSVAMWPYHRARVQRP